MNKKPDRKTPAPFRGSRYDMKLNDFCEQAGIQLKVVLSRLNTSNWPDFDAILVPTEAKDVMPNQVRRILYLQNHGWSNAELARRFSATEDGIESIRNMTDYQKSIFENSTGIWLDVPEDFDPVKVWEVKA